MLQVSSRHTPNNLYHVRDSTKTLRNLLAEDDLLRATFLDSPYRHPTIQHPLINSTSPRSIKKAKSHSCIKQQSPPKTSRTEKKRKSKSQPKPQTINWNEVNQTECRLTFNPLTKQSRIVPNPEKSHRLKKSISTPVLKTHIEPPSLNNDNNQHHHKIWRRVSKFIQSNEAKSTPVEKIASHPSPNLNHNTSKPWLTRVFKFV